MSPGDIRRITNITEIPVVLGLSVMHEISVNAKTENELASCDAYMMRYFG